MESLGPMQARVRAAAPGPGSAAVLRAETALEELLSNSVVHGGAARRPDACVWLGVRASAQALTLRFEDMLPAFDPQPKIAEAMQRTTHPMDQRPLGGLGLLMVYRLADEFHYVRENGRNCMELSFRAVRGADQPA